MADKRGAYGAAVGDTSFRRTWDKEEYAQRAATKDVKSREEAKARYEAKLAGKKYHRRASTPPDARDTEARSHRLDVGQLIGKTTLVPAAAAVGKRGRGAGFYCESCDLTFKDNLQYVEHLNSKQHLVAIGQTGEVRRAGVDEVHNRLRWLKRKREEETKDMGSVDFQERHKAKAEEEERQRDEKRRKRNERRRKNRDGDADIKIEG